MKKIYLPWMGMLLLCLSTHLHAQSFFQHTYGNTSPGNGDIEVGNDGHRTVQNFDGHIISGTSLDPNMTVKHISFACSDMDGNVWGGTTFGNYYAAMDFAGVYLYPDKTFCAEVNGTDYALAGVAGATSPTTTTFEHVFYAWLDNLGNVIASYTYSSPNYNAYWVNDIVTDPTRREVYIMGGAVSNANDPDVFVMKVQYDGTLVWSQFYDLGGAATVVFESAMDGVVLPGGTELAIVGNSNRPGTALTYGFLYVLDAATGLPVGSDIMVLREPSVGYYATCVDHSTDPTVMPSMNGFVIGGHTQQTFEPSAYLVDANLSVPWFLSNSYASSYGSYSPASEISDIQCRPIGTTGQMDYLMTGRTYTGYYGFSDIEVWRIDNSMIGSKHFVFGDNWIDEAAAIDLSNTTGNDAMIVFGTKDGANDQEMLISRSYFSGHLPVGCNWSQYIANETNTLTMTTRVPVSPTGDAVAVDGGSVGWIGQMFDNVLCFDNSVPGGDNTKTQSRPALPASALLTGNPVDGYALTVSEVKASECAMVVTVRDMTGRILRTASHPLHQGENKISLGHGLQHIAAGVYLVQWTCDEVHGAQKIVLNATR